MSFAVPISPQAGDADRKPPSVVVGIDFGTYASGFAYRQHTTTASDASVSLSFGAFGSGPLRVSIHDRWPDQPAPDAKTRTALLYKGDRVAAWGWTAWKRWSEMSSHERRTSSYTYLENFKLLLEEGAAEGVDTVCSLPSGVTRVQAVADYLGEIRKYIREQLRRCGMASVNLTSDEVVWCLTVPAIWSDAAKARMREAAHRAGMTVQMDSRSLSLTLEPEAAALSAVLMGEAATRGSVGLSVVHSGGVLTSGSASGLLCDGDVLLVLDCGGGTADFTLHRVRGSGTAARLEEAAVGRGALAGGAHVDSTAWTYIRELLGPQNWDAWKEAHPDEVVKIKSKWELSKRSFLCTRSTAPSSYSSSYSATTVGREVGDVSSGLLGGLMKVAGVQRNDIRLPLPPGLVSIIGHQSLRALRQPRNDRGWVGADQALVLPAEVVAQQIFDPVVDRIIAGMRDVMSDGTRLGNTCTKVLLAGGFARSPHLQSRVSGALGPGIPLLVPADPGAAVVTGAVIYGVLPYMVTARRCRVGYGTNVARPWTREDQSHSLAHGYPEEFWHKEETMFYADVYCRFVDQGQLVQVDEVVKQNFVPLYSSATSVRFDLYSTSDNTARYLESPGMHRHLSISLELPTVGLPLRRREDRKLEVEMRFGGTELSLVATDVLTKNSVATSIRFDGEPA